MWYLTSELFSTKLTMATAHLCCLFYIPYVIGLRSSATKFVCTPWSGSTLLLAGYELLRRPPRALDSSAEVSGSSCCGCGRVCWLCLCHKCPQAWKHQGDRGWLSESREKGVPSVKMLWKGHLSHCRAIGWEGKKDSAQRCPLTQAGRGVMTAWAQPWQKEQTGRRGHAGHREMPLLLKQNVTTAHQRSLTPPVHCLRRLNERECGHDAEKTGTNPITLEPVQIFCHWTLVCRRFIEIPLFTTSPDICRCTAATLGPQCRVSPWLGY